MRKIYHFILIKLILVLLVFGWSHVSWSAFYVQGGVGAGVDSDRNVSAHWGIRLIFCLSRAPKLNIFTHGHIMMVIKPI